MLIVGRCSTFSTISASRSSWKLLSQSCTRLWIRDLLMGQLVFSEMLIFKFWLKVLDTGFRKHWLIIMLNQLITHNHLQIFQVLLSLLLLHQVMQLQTKMKMINNKIILALIFKIPKFLELIGISKILTTLNWIVSMIWFNLAKKWSKREIFKSKTFDFQI